MTPGPRIEPGTQWWKASALTTAPTLLLKKQQNLNAWKLNLTPLLRLCRYKGDKNNEKYHLEADVIILHTWMNTPITASPSSSLAAAPKSGYFVL